MDERHGVGRALVDLLEELDELRLTLASPQNPDHLPAADVEGREQLQSALALVLVLQMHRNQTRLGGSRSRRPRAGLERGLLVERQNPLVGRERTRVELEDIEHVDAKRLVSRDLGTQPEMDAPRFELVALEDSLHGLRRDRLDDLPAHERASELRARPERQRAPRLVR